jgi:Tol biopolymer transport system component
VRIRLGVLLTALTVGLTPAALGGDGSATPAHALLTFAAPQGGICAVRADGSHARRLLPPWRVAELAWSPDGRYVAFTRATASQHTPTKVSVADARGRIRSRFGVGNMYNGSPLWSPDVEHIAYLAAWAHSWALMVVRPDGSEEHGVSGDLGWPTSGPDHPAWSPDGQRIAFDGGGSIDYPQGIYSVRVDGSDRRLLVKQAAQPAYSPDGTKLAYVAKNGPGVFVANADGSDPHAVSSRTVSWMGWGPSWSPDGRLLAFAALASPEVVVANADGSGERVIADLGSRWVRSAPQWSPDGALLAFTQIPAEYRPFRSSIVVARADGSGWRIIVRNRYSRRDLHSLAWRPAVPLPTARRIPCRRR